ncbi:acetaldehyde dehydrogenase (acetylating) [Streptomyces sp. MMBL 11-3]|uniref:acetaldehyde dehydrogenase (acetylating) n=1 Tax=Streptomyces sp. MMBL 11-3 TaxID=3382639 RepID=UPI0039B633D8
MAVHETELKTAVLGAGLVGLDLIDKIRRSPRLACALVAGRDSRTPGLRHAAEMGCATTAGGVQALLAAAPFDIVFDASSAAAHTAHAPLLAGAAPWLLDLTPSNLGLPALPTVNSTEALASRHISLISCGGQASIPLLHAISQTCTPHYVEVVTTAATGTVGPASRLHIDEYIVTTQDAIRAFTGTAHAKVLVNISPAQPPPPFRVTMTVRARDLDAARIHAAAHSAAHAVQSFAAGFAITSCTVTGHKATLSAEVRAPGGRLPSHAGNLHIINAAAVLLAEQHPGAKGR